MLQTNILLTLWELHLTLGKWLSVTLCHRSVMSTLIQVSTRRYAIMPNNLILVARDLIQGRGEWKSNCTARIQVRRTSSKNGKKKFKTLALNLMGVLASREKSVLIIMPRHPWIAEDFSIPDKKMLLSARLWETEIFQLQVEIMMNLMGQKAATASLVRRSIVKS